MPRRFVCFTLMILLTGAAPALAAEGVSLAWDDCGAAGTALRTFACNTNTGSDPLFVSFTPPAGLQAFYQLDADVQIGTVDLALLPNWWSFVPVTGCRRASLTVTGDFSTASGACADPYNSQAIAQAVTSVVPFFPDGSVRRLRVHTTVTLPNAAATPLDPGTEYYGVRLSIGHQKTVGTGACEGCSLPMCLALGNVSLLDGPAAPRQFVLPQTARHAVTWNSGTSCDRLVPVRNRTWGALKSFYR